MQGNSEIILSDMAKRFLQALSTLGITGYKLKKDGVINNEATLTKIKQGKQKPSSKTIELFCKLYSVDKGWIYAGAGSMSSENEGLDNIPLPYTEESNVVAPTPKGVPYFENTEATGSILSMYNDQKEIPTFYIDYEHFNDCTAYIPVVGDSMYPKYCSGEIVAVKKINNMDAILWGETYLVVTNSNANDLRTIKDVHQCDQEDKIILRASNPSYKGDTIINKSDIVSMFIIKGKIKRNQL